MKEVELTIHNTTGLHARPAKVFVKTAKKFESKIQVQHGTKKVNAKSMISILTLGVESGGRIQLFIDGPDETEALEILTQAVKEGLGDEQPAPTPAKKEEAPSPESAQPEPEAVVEDEHTIKGVAGATGIAIGPIFQYQLADIEIADSAAAPAEEKARLEEALANAQSELETLHQEMVGRLGSEEAAIFEAHLAILEDAELLDKATEQIEAGRSAAQAWQETIQTTAGQLATVKNELLAARAADVQDVGRRVLRLLAGGQGEGPQLPDHPVILVADDLSPSDTAALDPERVLGFCTATGGPNAHTAILARALGLPAIVGAGPRVLKLADGTQVILNGNTGQLKIDPDEASLAEARATQEAQQAEREAALQAASESATTQDGHRVEVVANIGNLADAKQAVSYGAEGVGLLRTEFLFLERQEPPTEEEQFAVYRDIALALENQPVIIRTLDVGGDKPLPYLPMPAEENPFLGQRGIRLCLDQPELLRSQLRAILRAAEVGPLRIMFPMVTSFNEWQQARAMAQEIQAELEAPAVELGIMIEIPAAALLAPVFAQEVDFFSIGTNDLTQYTLAMDRTHPALSGQADGLHPAVLKLIQQTVDAAHAAGKWVGVCGELGADPMAVPVLVGLGVDELSVSVPAIPIVKAQIRGLTRSAAQELAAEVLKYGTPAEVRRQVAKWQESATNGSGGDSNE